MSASAALLAIDRQAVASTTETIMVPKFPGIPDGTKNRFPELKAVFARWESDVEKWRQEVQLVINRYLATRERPIIQMSKTTCVVLEKSTQEALRGSGGVPSNLNRFVTESDLAREIQAAIANLPQPPAQPPGGATTYEGGGTFYGVGDPNFVITALRGAQYHEFGPSFSGYVRTWIKLSASGNTGWV